MNTARDVHHDYLASSGFKQIENPVGFSSLWQTYTIDSPKMKGRFYACSPEDSWQISIHDFTLKENRLLEFEKQEYISIGWYESISGEQFSPYRRLRPSSLWGFSAYEGWHGLVHGDIPVKSVTIEIKQGMLQKLIADKYWGSLAEINTALLSINEDADIPEMRALLKGLWPQPGDKERSVLFYEGKAIEAVGLLVQHSKRHALKDVHKVPEADRQRIREVAQFIDDHCASALRLDDLAQAACMSPTKFKSCFKAVTGSTMTTYIQSRRMSMAESLLHQPDLTIEQVARAVGYTCTSRFSELYQRETGMLPSELRKILQ
ncbi:AraC family transcriptional regulator [Cryptobacterium curtum]|mgnify:CR=1 FL=1|uniref:helix-turn-helix transcriptional regulator n=1 Tax=Cryptobacterium curtum TaxID=84163 RepID=UPI0023565F31|nr:AraC family transcriptional regulator [Cryptobacterium curtum]